MLRQCAKKTPDAAHRVRRSVLLAGRLAGPAFGQKSAVLARRLHLALAFEALRVDDVLQTMRRHDGRNVFRQAIAGSRKTNATASGM